jgi:hypothetical protein
MLYEMTVPQAKKMLHNLLHILDKGAAYADAKKIDSSILLNSRLAPDQFNLIRQVQIACDTAKLGIARLAGKEAPSHDDKEQTLADLKARIDSTLSFLGTFSAKDFAGAEEKRISTPRWEDKTLSGLDYTIHHILPNMYFHITTAYAILRHNGVEVGKKDYLGELPFKK